MFLLVLTKILRHALGAPAKLDSRRLALKAICEGPYGEKLSHSLEIFQSLRPLIRTQLETFHYNPINDLLGIQYHHSSMHMVTFEAAKYDSPGARLADAKGLQLLLSLKLPKLLINMPEQTIEETPSLILAQWANHVKESMMQLKKAAITSPHPYFEVMNYLLCNEDSNLLSKLFAELEACLSGEKVLDVDSFLRQLSMPIKSVSQLKSEEDGLLGQLETLLQRISSMKTVSPTSTDLQFNAHEHINQIDMIKLASNDVTFVLANDWALLESLPSFALACLRLNTVSMTTLELGSVGLNCMADCTSLLKALLNNSKQQMSIARPADFERGLSVLYSFADFCCCLLKLRDTILDTVTTSLLPHFNKVNFYAWKRLHRELLPIIHASELVGPCLQRNKYELRETGLEAIIDELLQVSQKICLNPTTNAKIF
ncbi:hypothetical protein Ciccas_005736 [Cichlidogyrus casuarinus]|uniref:Uncharacterized protein n=1 Tax=Cichlidogyrus casuarinus TaxID=1844966 RepID=A0ABD2Q7T5_9PLAT